MYCSSSDDCVEFFKKEINFRLHTKYLILFLRRLVSAQAHSVAFNDIDYLYSSLRAMDVPPARPSEELKRLVRAVLAAEEGTRVPLRFFEETFRKRTNDIFPWQELNFQSACECLEMMKEVCLIEKLAAPLRTGSESEELFIVLKTGVQIL